MRALTLDFANAARRSSPGWRVALLAAGGLTLAVLALHSELQTEATRLDARLARLQPRAANTHLPGRVDEAVERQVMQANEVIERLALPWDRLFRAVEGAATPRVVLLGIAPEPRAGTLQITGEAIDSEAMFDYVQRLEQQPELTRIFLLQHQREERRAGQPLRFVAVGSWIESQPR